jgi:hypothetical protein
MASNFVVILVSLLLLQQQLQVEGFRSLPRIVVKGSMLPAVSERTRSFFEKMDSANNNKISNEGGGAGSSTSLIGLERLDENWAKLRKGSWKDTPFQIVYPSKDAPPDTETSTSHYDVLVCGGTLGIFYAAAMQLKVKSRMDNCSVALGTSNTHASII